VPIVLATLPDFGHHLNFSEHAPEWIQPWGINLFTTVRLKLEQNQLISISA